METALLMVIGALIGWIKLDVTRIESKIDGHIKDHAND